MHDGIVFDPAAPAATNAEAAAHFYVSLSRVPSLAALYLVREVTLEMLTRPADAKLLQFDAACERRAKETALGFFATHPDFVRTHQYDSSWFEDKRVANAAERATQRLAALGANKSKKLSVLGSKSTARPVTRAQSQSKMTMTSVSALATTPFISHPQVLAPVVARDASEDSKRKSTKSSGAAVSEVPVALRTRRALLAGSSSSGAAVSNSPSGTAAMQLDSDSITSAAVARVAPPALARSGAKRLLALSSQRSTSGPCMMQVDELDQVDASAAVTSSAGSSSGSARNPVLDDVSAMDLDPPERVASSCRWFSVVCSVLHFLSPDCSTPLPRPARVGAKRLQLLRNSSQQAGIALRGSGCNAAADLNRDSTSKSSASSTSNVAPMELDSPAVSTNADQACCAAPMARSVGSTASTRLDSGAIPMDLSL